MDIRNALFFFPSFPFLQEKVRFVWYSLKARPYVNTVETPCPKVTTVCKPEYPRY